MGSMASMDSALNVITSSMRFRNSGRNVWRSESWMRLDSSASRFAAVSTSMFIMSSASWPMDCLPPMPLRSSASRLEYSRMNWLPTFDVMMMMAFLKLTTRPWPSVRRPSSSTCSRMLNTSGCAFSISSSRMTQYGLRRTASVSWPPSS